MSFLTLACSFTEASQIPTADRVRMGIASEEMWSSQRASQPASILAIGTAVPEDCFYQEDFPDYYFRVTGSEHMTELKKKFVRICERSMIKKRHMILTEDFLKENPICSYDAPSLNVRQETLREYIPKLAAKAASKAIEEWGQPKSKITHVVICSTVPAEMPGVDIRLIKHLGLNTSVKRVMLYNQGCFAGGTALRIAKDLAENNANARVLAVCAESILGLFRGPSENDLGSLVGQAIFSDGACSVIIGADPIELVERPIFQIMFTSETIIPDSGDSVSAQLREVGLIFNLSNRIPNLIADNIEKNLAEAFSPVGITDWNSIFWIPHPGGPKILDQIEEKLQLDKERFSATRYVLQEYGNMSSVCVLFILDEVRRRSKKERMATTGEGLEWGVLCSFGPGLTVETVVLRSCPTV